MELFDMLKAKKIIYVKSGVPALYGTAPPVCRGYLAEGEELEILNGTAERSEENAGN